MEIRKHHPDRKLTGCEGLVSRFGIVGDSFADGDIGQLVNIGNDVTDLAGTEPVHRGHFGSELAQLSYGMGPVDAHKADFLFDCEASCEYPDIAYYTAIIITVA